MTSIFRPFGNWLHKQIDRIERRSKGRDCGDGKAQMRHHSALVDDLPVEREVHASFQRDVGHAVANAMSARHFEEYYGSLGRFQR